MTESCKANTQVLVQPKSGGAQPKKFSGASCRTCAPSPLSNSFRRHC